MDNDEFMKGMSDADWDRAEAIEAEIGRLLREGLTKEVGMTFVRVVMEMQNAVPGATVAGVFETAMLHGLARIMVAACSEDLKTAPRKQRKRGSTLK